MDFPRAIKWLAGLAFSLTALAQSSPRLDVSSATWFQRGTTNEFTCTGDSLTALSGVLLSGDGLQGVVVTKSAAPVTLEGSNGGLVATPVEAANSVTIRLAVSPDAALGAREMRVAGPNGVSNPLTLQVSDLPEIKEPTPNSQPADAPIVRLPAAISGIIGASAEADYFRFSAKAGETFIFDVQANRFGSPLDPTLVLLDSTGKELARSEDAHGLDPFLEFKAPADGEYVLKVHDLRFQGGGDYRYRLVAGTLPYLEFLFPFGGRRGSSVDVQLEGRGLEGAAKLNVRVASDAPLGRQELRAHTSRGFSNPQPFEAGDLPEGMETEPNGSTNQANAFVVPIVLNGKIGEPKDEDLFRIKSPTDQRLVLDVEARRFGSPLDALLTLMDAQGQVLQRNDDADGPDARIEFDAKKDTDYFVSIRDLTERGGGRFGYRLAIRPPNTTPDFTVRAAGGRFRVPRGGAVGIRCDLDRRNGFDGVVRVNGERLPVGVMASSLVLGPGANFGWLILTATEDAPLGYFPLSLRANGEASGAMLSRAVQFSESGWLTVLPLVPFTVDIAQTAARLEQNASTALDVSVARRTGFTGEVKVMVEDLPGLNVGAVTLLPNQARAKLTLNAAYSAETGTRPLLARAEGTQDGAKLTTTAAVAVPVTTDGIPLFLTTMLPGSPFFRTDPVKLSAVALPTNSTSAANSTEFVVKVDRRGLPGEIALSLEGLPAGVLATVVPIKADKNEATIRLVATEQAETGKDHTFSVMGVVTHNDRIWRQKTQPVTLTLTAPQKETAAASPSK